MRIEYSSDEHSESFYREAVNTAYQYRKLIRRPESKLLDMFKCLKIYIAICAAWLVLLVIMGLKWGMSGMTGIAAAMLLFVLILSGAYLSNLNKALSHYIKDNESSVLTLDDSGVEIEKGDGNIMRMAWNSIAFIRVFKESIYFVSMVTYGMIIAADRSHEEEIMEYLRTHDTGVKIIGAEQMEQTLQDETNLTAQEEENEPAEREETVQTAQEEAILTTEERVNKAIIEHARKQRKRRPRKRKLHSFIALLLAAAITVTGMPLYVSHAAGEDFDDFLFAEWKEMLESDYTTMHSVVTDPDEFGLKKPPVIIGKISYEQIDKEVSDCRKSLDKLHQFDYDSLDERQKHDYIAFEDYLLCVIGMESHPDLIEMFRPYTGMLTDVKDYLTDFNIYRKEDFDDYLLLIADFPSYMDQMLEFTKQQAAKGYFMEDSALDTCLGELDDMIAMGEENEYTIAFANMLDNYDGLTEEEKADYIARNRELVMTGVIPSYKKARDTLAGLRGSRSVGAMCEYSDGRDYYEWSSRYYCSSADSMENKLAFITKAFKEGRMHYITVINSNPSLPGGATIEDLESLDDVMEFLRGNMGGFPEGPDVDYTLSYLDPRITSDYTMAYYKHSPWDNIKRNIIRVNSKNVGDINTLYYTLSHEGFPGHMYQMTWYQNSGCNPLRHTIGAMGYQEGWACYVEKIMLDRSSLDMVSAEELAFNDFLSYLMYAGADIAVNGLGYDKEQLRLWLNEIGMGDDFTDDLYDAAISTPFMYLPYGYGCAKFWELRERTQSALGDKFDMEDYHLQLLTNGPRSFDLIESDLKAYVESQGCVWPEDYTFFASEKTVADESGHYPPDPTSKMPVSFFDGYGVLIIICAIIAAGVIALIISQKRRKESSNSYGD